MSLFQVELSARLFREGYLCAMRGMPKALLLLYVLLGYVVAQFSWWAYLIYDLNADLIILAAEKDGQQASGKVLGKLWMIVGEGTVFLSLLLIGAIYIRKFILREQRLAKQERNFLLSTTHEFNSPIAAIKLNLQTLMRRSVSEEQQKQVLEGALSANSRLESLVSNLLMASRLDAGKMELIKAPFELDKLVEKVVQRFRALASESGTTLSVDVEANLRMVADDAAVETILGNLLENALKYAPKSDVQVRAYESDTNVVLLVLDSGSGISDEEKANVIRKFYRIENEETRTQKGSGLGLYLVKQLCDLHEATLEIGNQEPTGTQIKILFRK